MHREGDWREGGGGGGRGGGGEEEGREGGRTYQAYQYEAQLTQQ